MARAIEELSLLFHLVYYRIINNRKCPVVTVLYHAVLDCRNNVSKGTKLGGVLVRKTDTQVSSITVSLVAQSCLTLCDPMDCISPGFPVHHQPPELAQTYVHQVSDAI